MSSILKCKMAKITKLKNDKFFGEHPNGVDEGFTIEADVQMVKPIVGLRYHFGRLTTWYVTKILEFSETHCVFKTKNSTYKIET